MAPQNPHLPFNAGQRHHINFLREQAPLWGDNINQNRHRLSRFLILDFGFWILDYRSII
jgi:hypothetical protein